MYGLIGYGPVVKILLVLTLGVVLLGEMCNHTLEESEDFFTISGNVPLTRTHASSEPLVLWFVLAGMANF